MPTNWYPITCPTFLSGFPLFYIIGVGCAAGLMIIIVVTMICCRCIGCGVHPADGKSRIYHGRMTPRRQLELTACILMMVGAGAAGGAIAYMFISGGTLPDFTTQPIWMSVAISGCAVILIASILYYIGLCVINPRKRQVHCLPSVAAVVAFLGIGAHIATVGLISDDAARFAMMLLITARPIVGYCLWVGMLFGIVNGTLFIMTQITAPKPAVIGTDQLHHIPFAEMKA